MMINIPSHHRTSARRSTSSISSTFVEDSTSEKENNVSDSNQSFQLANVHLANKKRVTPVFECQPFQPRSPIGTTLIVSPTSQFNAKKSSANAQYSMDVQQLYNALKQDFCTQAKQLAQVQSECTRAYDESKIHSAKVNELAKVVADQQQEIERLRSLSEVHSGQNEVLRSVIREREVRQQSAEQYNTPSNQMSGDSCSSRRTNRSNMSSSAVSLVHVDQLKEQNTELTSLNRELQKHIEVLRSKCDEFQKERQGFLRKLKHCEFEVAQNAIDSSLQAKTYSNLQAECQVFLMVQQMANEELNGENEYLKKEVKKLQEMLASQSEDSSRSDLSMEVIKEQKVVAKAQEEMRRTIAETSHQLRRAEHTWRNEKSRLTDEIAFLQAQLKSQEKQASAQIAGLESALEQATKVTILVQDTKTDEEENTGITEAADVVIDEGAPDNLIGAETIRGITSGCSHTNDGSMQSRIDQLEGTITELKETVRKQHSTEKNKVVVAAAAAAAPNTHEVVLPQTPGGVLPVYQNNFFYNPFDPAIKLSSRSQQRAMLNSSSFLNEFEERSYVKADKQSQQQNNHRTIDLNKTLPVAKSNGRLDRWVTTTTAATTPKAGYSGGEMSAKSATSRQAQMDHLMSMYAEIKRRTNTPTSRC